MTTYQGGRFWQLADDLTGNQGQTHLNEASKQGIVHRPVAGLNVDVTAFTFIDNAFILHTFAGATGVVLPANEPAVYIYLDALDTVIVNNTGFPGSGWFVALAIAVTSATDVLSITNVSQMSPQGSAGAGVNSLTANSPLVQSGTAMDPILDLPNASGGAAGAMSVSDFNKLAGIEAGAQVVNQANIIAGTGLTTALATLAGSLLVGTAPNTIGELLAGSAGQLLTSQGPGSPLIWSSLSAFLPQVLYANSDDGQAGGAPLSFNAAKWQSVFNVGSIAVNGGNPEIININVPGKYLVVAMMSVEIGSNPSGNFILHEPATGGKIGEASINITNGSSFTDNKVIIGAFDAPAATTLSLESSINQGSNGIATSEKLRNQIIVFKIAD